MKKIFQMGLALALVLVASGAPAYGASSTSTSYFQNISSDTPGDAATMDPSLDLLGARVEITSENDFGFWIYSAAAPKASSGGVYAVVFDTNRDGQKDFLVLAESANLTASPSAAEVFDYNSAQVVDCDATTWSTSSAGKPVIAFSVSRSCIPVGQKVDLRFSSSQPDNANSFYYDWLPGQNSFETFNTDFMAGQTCKAAKNGARISYLGKAFICQKTGNAWKFVDYGQVLAKKAKYATDKAYYTCLYSKVGASLADGNKTLQIDAIGKYFITLGDFDCVKRVMAVPSWLSSQIGITRALDGMQKATFGQYIATWTYHPDNGLNIVIRKK